MKKFENRHKNYKTKRDLCDEVVSKLYIYSLAF